MLYHFEQEYNKASRRYYIKRWLLGVFSFPFSIFFLSIMPFLIPTFSAFLFLIGIIVHSHLTFVCILRIQSRPMYRTPKFESRPRQNQLLRLYYWQDFSICPMFTASIGSGSTGSRRQPCEQWAPNENTISCCLRIIS